MARARESLATAWDRWVTEQRATKAVARATRGLVCHRWGRPEVAGVLPLLLTCRHVALGGRQGRWQHAVERAGSATGLGRMGLALHAEMLRGVQPVGGYQVVSGGLPTVG